MPEKTLKDKQNRIPNAVMLNIMAGKRVALCVYPDEMEVEASKPFFLFSFYIFYNTSKCSYIYFVSGRLHFFHLF